MHFLTVVVKVFDLPSAYDCTEWPEVITLEDTCGLKNSYRACKVLALRNIGPNSNLIPISLIFFLNVNLAFVCLLQVNIRSDIVSSRRQVLHLGFSVKRKRYQQVICSQSLFFPRLQLCQLFRYLLLLCFRVSNLGKHGYPGKEFPFLQSCLLSSWVRIGSVHLHFQTVKP